MYCASGCRPAFFYQCHITFEAWVAFDEMIDPDIADHFMLDGVFPTKCNGHGTAWHYTYHISLSRLWVHVSDASFRCIDSSSMSPQDGLDRVNGVLDGGLLCEHVEINTVEAQVTARPQFKI